MDFNSRVLKRLGKKIPSWSASVFLVSALLT
ncbi:MAG: hypothetical protein ACLTE2_05115 [Eubacteriales bacterium]